MSQPRELLLHAKCKLEKTTHHQSKNISVKLSLHIFCLKAVKGSSCSWKSMLQPRLCCNDTCIDSWRVAQTPLRMDLIDPTAKSIALWGSLYCSLNVKRNNAAASCADRHQRGHGCELGSGSHTLTENTSTFVFGGLRNTTGSTSPSQPASRVTDTWGAAESDNRLSDSFTHCCQFGCFLHTWDLNEEKVEPNTKECAQPLMPQTIRKLGSMEWVAK